MGRVACFSILKLILLYVWQGAAQQGQEWGTMTCTPSVEYTQGARERWGVVTLMLVFFRRVGRLTDAGNSATNTENRMRSVRLI
ncbi:hypothetical protein BJV78DRAFT_1194740 [Lactifluus subvellereus]|nr:hypothetical protein BJV78DRAFT_1194740 [Lactifluus subvellereus]